MKKTIKEKTIKTKILFLGRFTPPMHGAAKMDELYFDALDKDKNFDVRKIKINKYDVLIEIGKINKAKICIATFLMIIFSICAIL